MKRTLIVLTVLFAITTFAFAAAKPKIVSFGRWMTVQWSAGEAEPAALVIKVRALMVNGDVREFTTGESHAVTDRVFVVQRAFRLNDSLPADETPSWAWQPGGWLLEDRPSAHITKLTLPEYDPYYSRVSWYRDFAAYCGVSDTGDKLYAMVAQIGRRKPILKKALGAAKNASQPDSECTAPEWQKKPVRVSFAPIGADKVTFTSHGHTLEIAAETGETGGGVSSSEFLVSGF